MDNQMTDDQVKNLYVKNIEHIGNLLQEGVTPVAIAAVMVAQALSMYRTILPEEDYERMCLSLYESRDKVHKFEPPMLQ
jgi:hypothetical protein